MQKMQKNHVLAWKLIIVAFVLTIRLHKDHTNQHRVFTRDAAHATNQCIAQEKDLRQIHPNHIVVDEIEMFTLSEIQFSNCITN